MERNVMGLIYYKDFLKAKEWAELKLQDYETIKVYNKKGFKETYSCLPLSFDIETTRIGDTSETVHSYMYMWMYGIADYRVFGTTWQDLNEWSGEVNKLIQSHQYVRCSNGAKKRCKVKFFGFIENMGFEWAFLKGNFIEHITDGFFKEKRHPLYLKMDDVTWLDSMLVTGMSLENIAKNFTKLQKMTGDLDYNIKRNSKDPFKMSKKELKYCEMDVAILTEYHKYYVNTFLKNGIKQLVYTRTGIARAILRRSFHFQTKITHSDIEKMYPDEATYKMHMKYLLRGGYVHANGIYTNQILHDVFSDDITSAHPAQMCHKLFPMSEFKKCNATFETMEIGNAYIFDVTLKKVKSKTSHSIESLSKCVSVSNPLIDNGRVHECDSMRVLITDIDFKIYKMFYTWCKKDVIYHRVVCAKYANLPGYVVRNVLTNYENKEKKKLAHLDYYLEKTFVNSIFGCTITRYNDFSITLKNGVINEKANDYNKMKKEQILSPYWGIWTTAYTRLQQLSLIYIDPDACIYGDTDSDKHFYSEYIDDYITSFNINQEQLNQMLAVHYRKDFELLKELGKWDREKTADYFKTCGCKRYGAVFGDKYKLTVAGLPKKSILPVKKPQNVLKILKDGLCVRGCKLCSVYSDETYTDIINGEQMVTNGCVSLIPIDFTLGMLGEYVAFLRWLTER